MSWKALGSTPPNALLDARLQLHHAAQVVASAGITFLAPEPDDSHPNFEWVEHHGVLMGRPLNDAGVQVGLRIADLSLVQVGEDGEIAADFALHGRTLEDACTWLAQATDGTGLALPAGGLVRPAYDIPEHAVADGAAFSLAPEDAFSELARWFANAHLSLSDLLARTPAASDVRCWPHHFDLGSLVVVARRPDASLAQSIGIGLSPGDESYAEPYWYVSPWPYPPPGSLPALDAGGHWHTTGFTAAIFTSADLVGGPADTQQLRLDDFLDGAVAASRRLLAAQVAR